MKRFCAQWEKDGYCNIPIDRLEVVEDVVFLYRGGDLVGMFSFGSLYRWWISEEQNNNKKGFENGRNKESFRIQSMQV